MNKERLVGWIGIGVGAIGCLFTWLRIQSDKEPSGLLGGHYTYTRPFSAHETTMVILMALFVAVLLFGIIYLLHERSKWKF